VRLTPATRNNWTSGWDGNWFYCGVPVEQKPDVRGKGSYQPRSTMTLLSYLTETPSSCGPEDTNFVAFIEVASIIGGCDVVEEFSLVACGLLVRSLV
jgi:hypothetical protein